jgi:hypothetical protein
MSVAAIVRGRWIRCWRGGAEGFVIVIIAHSVSFLFSKEKWRGEE